MSEASDQRPRILLVDDDEHVLVAMSRALQGRYELTLSLGPELALAHLAKQSFDVVVSDMRMPGMDGAALLKQAKLLRPDAVRMILSGHSDLDAVAAAINEGGIFRFLIKPVSRETLHASIDAALEQKRLLSVEKELLERTLTGSIDALSETLALANPEAFGRARRLKRIVAELAREMGLPKRWQLEVAASLSQLGAVSLPGEIAHRFFTDELLSEAEKGMLARSASVPRQLLRHIPRLEPVIELVESLTDDMPSTSLEVATLRAAANIERRVRRGEAVPRILELLDADSSVPRPIVEAARRLGVAASQQTETRSVAVTGLQQGMMLMDDVRTLTGALLISSGHEVSDSLIMRLRNFAATIGVKEPLKVSLMRSETRSTGTPTSVESRQQWP